MRDILAIAHFECLQRANWINGRPKLDAFAVCECVYPIRQKAWDTPVKTLLNSDYIFDLNRSFADGLEDCSPPAFQNPAGWKGFLAEWTADCSLDALPFSESGTYILSTLFGQHLTTLGLLTAWTVTDAFGRQTGQPPLMISADGLGRLLEDLAVGGPPVFDVEEMRSGFPGRYSS